MNIGELFLDLGFDVDEEKLKDFDDKITAARNNLLTMSAVTAGVVYGLNAFLEGSIQNAVALRNFTNETGQSSEALSKWQTLVHLTNPAIGANEALASYKRLNDYLTQASLGRGAGSFALLGAQYHNGMSPEEAIESLRQALPNALKTHTRSQVSVWLQDIFGTPGVLNALLTSPAQAESLVAGKYQTQEQIKAAAELADKIAAISVRWQQFQNDMTVKWAPSILDALTKIERGLEKWIPIINHIAMEMGGWHRIAEGFLLYFAGTWAIGIIGSIVKVISAFGALRAAMAASAGLSFLGGLAGVVGAGITGAAGLALPFWLDDKYHWGQKFADFVAPVKSPAEIIKTLPPRVEHLSPSDNSTTNNVNHSVTQNINSTASAPEVAAHAVSIMRTQQQNDVNGIFLQLDQGPRY